MSAVRRARGVPLGAEVALAFGAGAASFALVALTLAATDSDVVAIGLGAACIGAVVAMTRWWGVAYAVPSALAALLAYDWFQFPPTHAAELPGSADLADLLAYLAVGVLVGLLAARAVRRAQESEVARGELMDEQAALRRVATLVARQPSPDELFAAVAEEAGRLLGVDVIKMHRYERDGTVTVVADWGERTDPVPPVGTRLTLEGDSVPALVRRTERPARIDDYASASGTIAGIAREAGIRCAVGAPIVVDGQLWGVMLAASKQADPLPEETDSRITEFTDLIATAISNTEARGEVGRLADEQAALRRVATLVARVPTPDELFAAVAEEVGRLACIDHTAMFRYDDDRTAIAVASWGNPEALIPIGKRVTLEGESVTGMVLRTRRTARIDDYATASGSLGTFMKEKGIRSAVAIPIVVDGRLWGAMVAGSLQVASLPPGTESRMGEFTELVATAISNIQTRSDLASSRARVVAAADEERRRVVRDLHDGAQQRLVHTVVTLKLADRALEHEADTARALVAEALHHAQLATTELRELAHGILPAVLTRGGLRAGVDALATRMPVPVETGVAVGRLPAPVEATAYFVVAEALTNVLKHSRARRAAVTASVDDGTLHIDVRDDGVGGARPDGPGLVGLADRLAVLDGRLRVESPAEGGTLVAATIPVGPGAGDTRR